MVEAGLHVSVHCESWTSLSYPGVRALHRSLRRPPRLGKSSIGRHGAAQHWPHEFRWVDRLTRFTAKRLSIDDEIPVDGRRQVDRQLYGLLVQDGAAVREAQRKDDAALFAGGLQPDTGKDAERHVLAFAAETVAVKPQPGPIGSHHNA